MIRLYINKKQYSYERVIFPDGIINSKADIVRYMRFYEKPEEFKNVTWDTYRTPVIDLMKSEDEIQSHYSKEVRYEVRRAGRENITFRMFMGEEITDELVNDVEEKYNLFCDEIQMPELKNNLDYIEFAAMVNNGNIAISKACFENGWTYHVYQIDGISALLWFSFSDYRKENANKSMSGWANRGLHNFDLLLFKNSGFHTYDWGNIASETDPNQIDKFKMAFGGEVKTAFCCFLGNTLKGKILVKLRELKYRK